MSAEQKALLAALKETRDAAAACFRVIGALGDQAINALDHELTAAGVKKGFGERAAAAINRAEGRK